MNTKKFVITSLAVFVVYAVIDWLINTLFLAGEYQALQHLWRPDMMAAGYMALYFIIGLIVSFIFVYIFIKGYEGKGLMEGVRFGVIIGLFATIPNAFGQYFIYPLPFSLAIKWFIFGMIEFIIIGLVAAALYKPKE